jgi:hypothetical protein
MEELVSQQDSALLGSLLEAPVHSKGLAPLFFLSPGYQRVIPSSFVANVTVTRKNYHFN